MWCVMCVLVCGMCICCIICVCMVYKGCVCVWCVLCEVCLCVAQHLRPFMGAVHRTNCFLTIHLSSCYGVSFSGFLAGIAKWVCDCHFQSLQVTPLPLWREVTTTAPARNRGNAPCDLELLCGCHLPE
jgi:hypothetical protein